MSIENTQVIDLSRRQKRRKRRNCGQLERIWNAESFLFFSAENWEEGCQGMKLRFTLLIAPDSTTKGTVVITNC